MASPQWNKSKDFEYALYTAPTGTTKYLIIYMHGVGGNARNPELDNLAADIHKKIPDADVICLQAPTEYKNPDPAIRKKGYTWFPYGGAPTPQIKTWLTHLFNRLTIADKIENFAKEELDKRGLAEDNLVYYGHSMGAMVALQAALSAEKEVAAVISASGAVPPFTTVKRKPKIFLQMGELDEIFNVPPRKPKGALSKAFTRAADRLGIRHARSLERLKRRGVPVTEKTYPKQGHVLNKAARREAIDFIAKALKP